MGKKAIWISYDFGLKGDYTGLYTWLDDQNAKECGNGLAYIRYDYKSPKFTQDSLNELITTIKEHVKLSKSDRLYLIWKDSDSGKIKGEFVSGFRRQSPWEGYGKLRQKNNIDSGE